MILLLVVALIAILVVGSIKLYYEGWDDGDLLLVYTILIILVGIFVLK